jgi:hypothetical protein
MKYYLDIKKNEICHLQEMDRTGEHNVKQNNPNSERQTSQAFSYMQNLEIKIKTNEKT